MKNQRTCPICGDTFTPNVHNQRVCHDEDCKAMNKNGWGVAGRSEGKLLRYGDPEMARILSLWKTIRADGSAPKIR